ncbi:hypothetical protein BDF20DRAFT_837639 [Mycotypha africana]|uniref:uncharacterized protein n=1 Tax=Mycotypha africana TaxID=64632 RepID=UPI002301831D|nr:uncharacterized protein BDF20DRAFT_837639 [Mycotypha africana]KAI8973722.1 hypothetical protein BDF20DRAFT_837639 [Mycotypha africana]
MTNLEITNTSLLLVFQKRWIDDDSISVTSASEEEQSQNIAQVQGDIAKYEFELRALDNKANLLMELPQSTEDEKKQAFYNRKFVEAHECLKCYREEAKSFSSPSGKQDGRAIKPKDLPVFEVTVSLRIIRILTMNLIPTLSMPPMITIRWKRSF